MDPVSLLVAALVAGASAGVTDAAASAVKDAYGAVKDGVARLFAGKPSAELVLASFEEDPKTWQAPLEKSLTESDAGRDEALIAAAQKLMTLVDPQGAQIGRYVVNISGGTVGGGRR